MKKIYVTPQTELLVLNPVNVCVGSLNYNQAGEDRSRDSELFDTEITVNSIWENEW